MTHKENVPKWVRQRFAATIQYMNEKGTSWIFKKLQDSDEVYYIQYTQNRKIGYKLSKKTIYWNPNAFYKNTNGTIVFPATILAHEGAHILQDIKYNNSWNEQATTKDPEYGNRLEREVITTIEKEVAIKHGDTYKGNVTRKDNGGEYIILTENDYKKIFNNAVTNEIPEINRELIDIYLYNTRWIKKY